MFVQFLTIISSVAHFDFLIFPEKCQEAAACVLASVFVEHTLELTVFQKHSTALCQ